MMKTGRMPMGKVPKGKGGSRPLDHCSVGKAASPAANKNLGMTGKISHALGKGHKSVPGGGKKCKDPGVKCYAQGPQGKHGGGY